MAFFFSKHALRVAAFVGVLTMSLSSAQAVNPKIIGMIAARGIRVASNHYASHSYTPSYRTYSTAYGYSSYSVPYSTSTVVQYHGYAHPSWGYTVSQPAASTPVILAPTNCGCR